MSLAPRSVEAKVDRDVVEQGDHLLFVHDARNDGAVFERIERYGAVHGPRVDEDISQLGCDGFRVDMAGVPGKKTTVTARKQSSFGRISAGS